MTASIAAFDADAPVAPIRTRRGLFHRLLRNRAAVVAMSFLVLLTLAAIFAPIVAPYDPNQQDLLDTLQGPSREHWLGTDGKGRDVFSRIIYAARVALMAPLLSVTLAVVIGVPAGLVAGITKGRLDAVMGRIADTLLSIPPIVMAIAIVAILGPGLTNAMFAVGIVYAPRLFRVVRSATLGVGGELYVDSARSIGCSTPRLLWSHVLPNVAAPLLVQVSLLMGFALLAEASLSFLGLGVQIPTASWGSMLRSAYDEKFNAPYAAVPPGVVLTATILAFNTLGDGLRDAITARRRT
jgi:peptide/nickel transport system permease protein